MKSTAAKLLLPIFIVAIAGGGAAVWWKFKEVREKTPGAETGSVARKDFAATVLATGEVDPQVGAEVEVGARISGKVIKLYANIGDMIETGDVIAVLEHGDLSARVEQQEAELRSALNNVQRMQADLKATKSQYWPRITADADYGWRDEDTTFLTPNRDEWFAGVAFTIPIFTGFERSANVQAAQADLRRAEAEVESAEAALENAKVQLSYATIEAPISGVIGTVATQEGETVIAGLQAPSFVKIIDLDRLEVDAYVDEVDIGKIAAGQMAEFTVDAFPGRSFKGRVSAIYPDAYIRENVVYYDVVIAIEDNYQGLLRPKMTTSVTIFMEKREDVLSVPTEAIQRSKGRNVVYVIRDGTATAQEVKTGLRQGRWVEIVEGLHEGQTVLLGSPESDIQRERGGI